MKTLKIYLVIPLIAFIMMSFSQCSGEKFDSKAPATITQSFYQNWVGGVPGSKGTLVTIKLNTPEKEVVFDSIYFNGAIVKLKTSSHEKGITLTGNFMADSKQNDIVMEGDPKKEIGNTPTKKIREIPFDLEPGEAIISYKIRNKTRYYKLVGIKKSKSLFYQ